MISWTVLRASSYSARVGCAVAIAIPFAQVTELGRSQSQGQPLAGLARAPDTMPGVACRRFRSSSAPLPRPVDKSENLPSPPSRRPPTHPGGHPTGVSTGW
jgi:hypothetical protein